MTYKIVRVIKDFPIGWLAVWSGWIIAWTGTGVVIGLMLSGVL